MQHQRKEAAREWEHELELRRLDNERALVNREIRNNSKAPKLLFFAGTKDQIDNFIHSSERHVRANLWREGNGAISVGAPCLVKL